MLLHPDESKDLEELIALLDEAYRHYFASGDGHCKSSEGHVEVSFGNYFDREDGKRVRRVEVYSYVLGPSRGHQFDSIGDALSAVRDWHEAEMNYDYTQVGEW